MKRRWLVLIVLGVLTWPAVELALRALESFTRWSQDR